MPFVSIFGLNYMCGISNATVNVNAISTMKSDDFQSKNIKLFSRVPLDQLSGDEAKGSDVWGWRDRKMKRDYALVALTTGTTFVDITRARRPKVVGMMPTETGVSFWRDVKTSRNFAYVVSDRNGSHGLQIFDLKRLRRFPRNQIFSPDRTYRKIKNAHNIAVHDGYAYVVGALKQDNLNSRTLANGGLYILDIRNPLKPVPVGVYRKDGYIHDTQVVTYKGPDKKWLGSTIAFNSSVDSFSIVSLERHDRPSRISSSNYNGAGFVHQGWLSEDHRFFFSNDSKDELNASGETMPRTHIWDVQKLRKPRYLGFHEGKEVSIDHNLYIKDDLVYQANYTSGLRVLRIKRQGDKEQSLIELVEVAYIDTYPQKKNVEIQSGAWSVYPYFADKFIVNDTDNGLFVAGFSSLLA